MVDVRDLRPAGQRELRALRLAKVEADDEVDVCRRRRLADAVRGGEEPDGLGDRIGAVPRDLLPHPLECEAEGERRTDGVRIRIAV